MTPTRTYRAGSERYLSTELSPVCEELSSLKVRLVNSEIAKLNNLVNAARAHSSSGAVEAFVRMRNALMVVAREMRGEEALARP